MYCLCSVGVVNTNRKELTLYVVSPPSCPSYFRFNNKRMFLQPCHMVYFYLHMYKMKNDAACFVMGDTCLSLADEKRHRHPLLFFPAVCLLITDIRWDVFSPCSILLPHFYLWDILLWDILLWYILLWLYTSTKRKHKLLTNSFTNTWSKKYVNTYF